MTESKIDQGTSDGFVDSFFEEWDENSNYEKTLRGKESQIVNMIDDELKEVPSVDVAKKVLLKGMLSSPFQWSEKFYNLYIKALPVRKKPTAFSVDINSRLHFLALLYEAKDLIEIENYGKLFADSSTLLKLWDKKDPLACLTLLPKLNIKLPEAKEDGSVISRIKCIMDANEYIKDNRTSLTGFKIGSNKYSPDKLLEVDMRDGFIKEFVNRNIDWLVMVLSIFEPKACHQILKDLDTDDIIMSCVSGKGLSKVLKLFTSDDHRSEFLNYLEGKGTNYDYFRSIVGNAVKFVNVFESFKDEHVAKSCLRNHVEHFRIASSDRATYDYIAGALFGLTGATLLIIACVLGAAIPILGGALLIGAGIYIACKVYFRAKKVKAVLNSFYSCDSEQDDGSKNEADSSVTSSPEKKADKVVVVNTDEKSHSASRFFKSENNNSYEQPEEEDSYEQPDNSPATPLLSKSGNRADG